jgi:hypothetical protein
MQKYIGTKVLDAEPMSRGDYNKHRGWTPPEGEDQDVAGYHVVYSDGYESWSPQDQFEEAYVVVPDYAAERILNTIREQTAELVR